MDEIACFIDFLNKIFSEFFPYEFFLPPLCLLIIHPNCRYYYESYKCLNMRCVLQC